YELELANSKVYVKPTNEAAEGNMLAELPYNQGMYGPERPIIASRQVKEQQTKQEKKQNKI
ncbi:hypothetical protein N4849_14700, partial [Enterococcus faecalis]|nr:hypothetical protein [Enterococcus faecalis]